MCINKTVQPIGGCPSIDVKSNSKTTTRKKVGTFLECEKRFSLLTDVLASLIRKKVRPFC